MVTFKCQCCGIERTLADEEAFFAAGWDTPPRFSQVVTCDLCPSSCVLLGISHAKAHAHWQAFGRPDEFGPKCLPNMAWRD